MKRIMILGIAVMVLASLGCARENLRQSQQAQFPQPAAAQVNMQMPAAPQQQYPGNQMLQAGRAPTGAPVGSSAYPYYTTRAPRDFLMKNPPTIGR
ncbi:MAG: hypothetical protein ACKVK0_18305 [Pirellulales bacterium]|jgi:hypothetical protein